MGWSMGWDVDDAHIHDDGRTLRPVREDEYSIFGGISEMPAFVPPRDSRQVFIYRGKKLIPDTVYIHSDAFLVTGWESLYSDVFGIQSPKLQLEASFAPVVDDSWRVIGHLGWADGQDICVPLDTLRNKFWSILQERRLGEMQWRLLADALRSDRGPYSSSPHSVTISDPPVRKPVPCVPPATKPIELKPSRGLEEKTIEEVYLNNLNYFVKGGGKAFVGRRFIVEYTGYYAPYLDMQPLNLPREGIWGRPKTAGSSGYRFQVLVNPEGYLLAVLGIEKVLPKVYGERHLSIALEVIDIAMTILMIIDIVTIPVVLFRLGARVAEKVAIRAAKVGINPEAKAALDLTMREMRELKTIPRERVSEGLGSRPPPEAPD